MARIGVAEGGRVARVGAPEENSPAEAEQTSWGSIARNELLLLSVLALLGILSRIFTTNSLAGEPTSDEYFFGVYARDLARSWASGAGIGLGALAGEGRTLALEAAALSFVLPWDQITIGRTVQALFNSLCVPATYLLGRQLGLARGVAGAGALLLMAVPEFQESAWRFWSDSQATFLGLLYLAALARFNWRPNVLPLLAAAFALLLLFATKDTVALTLAPFLVVALIPPLRRRIRSGRAWMLIIGASAVVVLVGAFALMTLGPGLEARFGGSAVGRVLGFTNRILASVPVISGRVPNYVAALPDRFAPANTSVGLLWTWIAGSVWIFIQAVKALVARRAVPSAATGWLAAAMVWMVLAWIPVSALGALGVADLWVPIGAAALFAAVAAVALDLGERARRAWGLAFAGLIVLTFFVQRLVIWATPDLPVAFTFRTFMPIVPLLALVGGLGVWGIVAPVRVLLGSTPGAHAAATAFATLAVVTLWSPMLTERTTTRPLLGRAADRGADPDKPEGLRVQALVGAEPWLRTHVRPGDTIATTFPRHLAWYADLGPDEMAALVDLRAHAQDAVSLRPVIMDAVNPEGVDYVVDFNVNWWRPDSPEARTWRLTYEWLETRPNVDIVYTEPDKFGYPAFYIARNNGYARSYGYVDREAARARQLGLVRP